MTWIDRDDIVTQRETASSCESAVGWLALGAGLMYLFDPNLGRRRRHVFRDRLIRQSRKLKSAADATARDAWHRGVGLAHEARVSMSPAPETLYPAWS